MNTIGTARFVSLTLIMAGALAVSGCGGGGGSFKPTLPIDTPTPPADTPTPPADTSTPPADTSTPPVQSRYRSSTLFREFDSVLTDAAQRRHIRTAVVEAAGNTPNAGSVTQSSAGDGVTTDSVSVSMQRDASGTASYGTISYTVRETDGWSVDRDSARVLAEPDEESYENMSLAKRWRDQGIEFHQAPGGGQGSGTGPGLYVYVYSDIKAPAGSVKISNAVVSAGSVVYSGSAIGSPEDFFTSFSGTFNGLRGTFRCISSGGCTGTYRRGSGIVTSLSGSFRFTPTETVQNTDYLAGGIWVRVPADAASVADYEFGAFADGSDPFRQANLAGLIGTMTYRGIARAVYSHQGMNRNDFVDADVRLTADFGDASSLGSISGTIANFTGEGPVSDWHDGVSVSLGAAQIGSADSGFFSGDTSTSGTDSAFTGKWGGQFYGNGAAAWHGYPGSVAGTFGAATADGSESIVGAYRARREQQ